MKTIIMSVIISLLFIIGFNNYSYAQRLRDRHGDSRATIRTHITVGTPAVHVRYSNRPHEYYYHTRYVEPRRVHYRYHRAYVPAERYWVPGFYDDWGYWVPGHWEWY